MNSKIGVAFIQNLHLWKAGREDL